MTSAARGRERPPPSQRWRARVRYGLWRWRRVLLVVALALVVRAVVADLRPALPATVPVVVAGRELPAGTQVRAGDLRVAQWPAELRAAAMVGDPEQLVGAHLAVGLPPGLPVTDSHVVGPGVASAAPDGFAALPVPVADAAVADLLRPGDRVDLVATTTDAAGVVGGAEVVASRALVLAHVPQAGGGGLLGGGGAETGLVVMAVPQSAVTEVVAASAWAPLRVLLRG